jgi:thiol-disulfide isomerase/thioredoxin
MRPTPLLALCLVGCASRVANPARTPPSLGEVLEAAPLRTLEGSEARWQTYGRPVTVLAFWATWCAPCLAELSELDLARRALADDPSLTILAVNVESEAPPLHDRIRAVVSQLGLGMPILRDPEARLGSELFRRSGIAPSGEGMPLPFLAVVARGEQLYAETGARTYGDTNALADHLRSLVAQAQGGVLSASAPAAPAEVDPSQIHLLTTHLSDEEFRLARPRLRERLRETYPLLTAEQIEHVLDESRSDH